MRQAMRRQRGFTLLEIMVVMVIVAVLAAVAAPNLFAAKSRGKDLEREASMLAARLRVAQDDAMLYGNEYGLVFSAEGYRFVRWDTKRSRFTEVGADQSWALRTFEDEVKVSAAADDGDPILVLPEPKKTEDGAAGGQQADDQPDWQPSVFVLSSGEVTPFTAVFSAEGAQEDLALRIDPLGTRVYPEGAEPVKSTAEVEAGGDAG